MSFASSRRSPTPAHWLARPKRWVLTIPPSSAGSAPSKRRSAPACSSARVPAISRRRPARRWWRSPPACRNSVVDFERRVAGRDVKPSGELRITTVDSMAVHLLPPILARFRQLNPGVHLDIILASQHLNLSRRDADVAIRATNEPSETLVGRRIGAIRWAIYSSPKVAGEFGAEDRRRGALGRLWRQPRLADRQALDRAQHQPAPPGRSG